MAEARTLARRAREAAPALAELSQIQIDGIVDAMAAAVTPQAEALARLACEETGFGVVADKVQKNLFASEKIYRFIRPMKTVGVINRLEDRKVIEIAEPFGVVAAIVPSTNPTSTAIYKILIALKARCSIVISPHPAAVRCITAVSRALMSSWVPSSDTVCIQLIAPSGQPADRAAPLMSSATRMMHRAADGCGLSTIGHRALIAMRIL